MDAASRYAREYVLARPAVVVLHAPTGYLKTSTIRIAAQRAGSSAIVDCRELLRADDVRASAAELVVFENAEAALGRPDVLRAIHDVLLRRGAAQTIAICTKRPFPLPASVLPAALELTHEDLALDVAEALAARDLAPERIEEIRRLTLGWPMPTHRLAALAAECPPGVPLTACPGRGYERLLQDVRLDFLDRLPAERRTREAVLALTAEPQRDLLAAKLARAEGLLLRDGARYRVPGIVIAALDAIGQPAEPRASVVCAPPIVFDVLAGEITAGGEIVRLPRRELEVFANLAIKGRHVPYDVLLEEVWGDADDDHAKLKVTVGRLRKRLGFATIRSLGAGYAIGDNVTCTLAELEELASRAEPFGPATIARLEGIRQRHRRGMTGVARNWPWYTAWSAKIDAFVEHATLALGSHALAQRRFALALERAHDAIALNPVSQEAHELALRALVAQGNAVAARQLLAGYAATLETTLGMAPPEALLRIVRERAS